MNDSSPESHNFPPNIHPTTYNLLAIAVGIILVGDLNANEQNSLGNWFLLLGQYLATNASQQQLIEARIENNNININSKKSKNGGGPFTSDSNTSNQTQRDEVNFILDSLDKISNELNDIKNKMPNDD
jgi:hypothetical protein